MWNSHIVVLQEWYKDEALFRPLSSPQTHSEVIMSTECWPFCCLCTRWLIGCERGREGRKRKEQYMVSYVWQINWVKTFLLCSPHLPNHFSDISIYQGPNENIADLWSPGMDEGMEGEGLKKGWLQKEGEVRENTLCPYFWVPSGIYSSWSFLFSCCCCLSLASVSLSLLFHSPYLSLPSLFSICICV